MNWMPWADRPGPKRRQPGPSLVGVPALAVSHTQNGCLPGVEVAPQVGPDTSRHSRENISDDIPIFPYSGKALGLWNSRAGTLTSACIISGQGRGSSPASD